MNDSQKSDKTQSEQNQDPITERLDEPQEKSSPAESGLRARLRRLLNAMQQRSPAKPDLTKDRTRSLTLLIAAGVAAVLLFIGVFSNPTRSPLQEMATRAAPNLGRPAIGNQPAPEQGSVTPLLNADVQSNNISSDQLSPADIRGTSRRSSESDEIGPPQTANANAGNLRLPRRSPPNPQTANTVPIDRNDPLAGYRTNSTGAPTYSYGGSPGLVSGAEPSRPYSYGGGGLASNDTRPDGLNSVKSSIVFVRASGSRGTAENSRTAATPVDHTPLLQPGTRLVARLEAAATTAVKTPVVASIEYNYERNGVVIVPAGAKAIGDVQQASTEGYLSVRFHTLQMPNGREEKIEGTGVALDYRPLKGEVSGKNTGKKILSRTLSGVGTIAAYVVGGGGAGLTRTITGETLLRDRVAGNIALVGEQELMNGAYAQNISVTVPANTRFYVVLQKAAGISPAPTASSQSAARPAQSLGIPTAQELRELMDLRREINGMYQESNGARPPEPRQ
jgi:hypothetical protein